MLDGIPSSSQQDLYKIELYNIELILDVSSILACQFQCPWKLILIKKMMGVLKVSILNIIVRNTEIFFEPAYQT